MKDNLGEGSWKRDWGNWQVDWWNSSCWWELLIRGKVEPWSGLDGLVDHLRGKCRYKRFLTDLDHPSSDMSI
jgi:hypothetical protein